MTDLLREALDNHVVTRSLTAPVRPNPGDDAADQAPEGYDLVRRLQDHPYQTLLMAAGVGYVLGGGLFTAWTARAVSAGARVALLPLVQRGVLGVVTSLTASPDR